jgi:hypothetical protein
MFPVVRFPHSVNQYSESVQRKKFNKQRRGREIGRGRKNLHDDDTISIG